MLGRAQGAREQHDLSEVGMHSGMLPSALLT